MDSIRDRHLATQKIIDTTSLVTINYLQYLYSNKLTQQRLGKMQYYNCLVKFFTPIIYHT